MSPRHFSLMIEGYNETKVDNYRVARILMFTMVKLLGDSKSGPKSPESLWPLPGDEDQNLINDEEVKQLFERLAEKEKQNQ
jgi:hypothetical protein